MRFLLLTLCTCVSALLMAQRSEPTADYFADRTFTRADTLRGALRPERTNFDVIYYDLFVEVDPAERAIEGQLVARFRVVAPGDRLQLDLYENLDLIAVRDAGGWSRDFERDGNAVFVDLGEMRQPGETVELIIDYAGRPVAAKNAPWDGGFVWSLDQRDRTWVGVACEGDGASLWWPNKDHLGDEPDSMAIRVVVPDRLVAVANGNLREVIELEDQGKTRYDWFVSYPINNYNVSINVGHYVHFDSTYVAADGEELALDYYVLDYNEEKARKQFRQVGPMLRAYEHYFGKYPFWEDGYALIETPYLGMEHQSGIAYGNRYMRGYLGGLIPDDMDWDYIIIHETGHEYFGNSVSVADHAEMWIHESFTTYMEALYVEYHYGEAAARRYLMSQRRPGFIKNESPILGPLDVNFTDFGSSDHYYKGAWVLHTLRHVLNDDPLFFGMLRSFYQEHQRSIVNTQQVVDYFSRYAGRDLVPFFAQYLRHPAVPVLELRQGKRGAEYRWRVRAAGFNMPVIVRLGQEEVRLQPTSEWQSLGKGTRARDVSVDETRFLVETELLTR